MTGFVLVASTLLTLGAHTHYHDADSVLPAIMSVRKLTWYYWNQNRFGNLLPLLASPVRGVAANLYVQVLLRQACGFLSVFFVLLLLGEREDRYERFFVAVLALLLTAFRFVGSFFNPAVPQPVSCAVFALGLWLLERKASSPPRQFLLWLSTMATFWVAFFVNLSLMVLVLPLGVLLWLLGTSQPLGRRPALGAVLLAAGLAWVHARQFEPRTPTGLSFRPDGLNVAAAAVLGELDLTRLAALLLAAAGCAALLRCCRPPAGWRAAPALPLPPTQLALLAALVLAAAVFANTTWVQQNGNASRYFNVMQLFAVVLPASWAVTLLKSAGRGTALDHAWTRRSLRLFLPLLSLLVVCLQAGAPGPLAFVSDNPARPLGIDADLPRILADVTPGRPMVAVGNYWTTVLLVYARLGTKGGGESYAVAGHWEPMRPEIRRLLQSGRAFTLVCMPPAAPECLVAAERWSGLAPEPRAVTYTAGATLDSGGAYAVLAVAQGSGATAP